MEAPIALREVIRINTRLLKGQITRNILSVRFLAVIGISVLLIVIQDWTANHAGFLRTPGYEATFLSGVMVFSTDGSGSGLYMMMLPFLAALLGGSVFATERYSKRLFEIQVREGRNRILGSCMGSGFVLGGVAGIMPLFLNLVYAAARNPRMKFIDGDITDASGMVANRFVLIEETSWAYPLYQFNQVLLIIVVVAAVFLLSGLFADLAVAFSFFTVHRYVEVLIPFTLSLLWWMLPSLTKGLVPDQWSHIIFLMPNASTSPEQIQQSYLGMGLAVVLPLLSCLVLTVVEKRRDIL